MIRILHAADLHLDSPFQAMGRDGAIRRRAEQRELLGRLGELAREREADLVLMAGDLFDSDNIFSDTGPALCRALSDMGVPVFIAPGNHDWYGPRSAWTRLTFGENVHVFTSRAVTRVDLPALGVRVWGAAFTDKHSPAPLAGFEAAKDENTVDIMVLHGEVGVPGSDYGPITEDELARCGMDYVALGHVHTFSGLRRAGETYYAWPGCPEGRGFDETGEKGVILAEVDPGTCRAEFIPLGGRRYESVRVDLTDTEDHLAAVTAALPADTGRDIYRVRLAGQLPAAPDVAGLSRALEGRFYALELRDETSLCRDIWAGCSGDSLKGLFLRKLRAMLDTAEDDDARERVTQAARLGLLAMENGEEPPLI